MTEHKQEDAWFHYCCDDVKDKGWGCVYRSWQNACKATGRAVPTMAELTTRVGIVTPVSRSYANWTEPACLMRGEQCASLFYSAPGYVRRGRQLSAPGDYAVQTSALSDLTAALRELVGEDGACPVAAVLDDGTFGYCVLVQAGEGDGEPTCTLLDPHTLEGSSMPLRLSWRGLVAMLENRPLWMCVVMTGKGGARLKGGARADEGADGAV